MQCHQSKVLNVIQKLDAFLRVYLFSCAIDKAKDCLMNKVNLDI